MKTAVIITLGAALAAALNELGRARARARNVHGLVHESDMIVTELGDELRAAGDRDGLSVILGRVEHRLDKACLELLEIT